MGHIKDAEDDGHLKLDVLCEWSVLLMNPTQADRVLVSNPLHLCFEPGTTQETKVFNKLLQSELMICIQHTAVLSPVINSSLEER